MNGVFGGSSDQTIGTARFIIQNSLKASQDFPYGALSQGLASRGRVTDFDDNNIEGILETQYGKRTCFLSLSLLYDTHNWGSTQHHIDHIIPRSLADRKTLMGMNLSETLIQRVLDSVNRLGNLQLLLGRENLEKSNIPFGQWIQTRDREFLDRHLIPNKPELWDVTALVKFVEAREELIRQRSRRLRLEPTAVNDTKSTMTESAVGN